MIRSASLAHADNDEPVLAEHAAADLPQLLTRTDGVTWVDIPTWDDEAERVLADTFGFHPLAIRDCRERNQVPKVHVYPGHVFLVLHAPHPGLAGHVHYIELDQFIGPNFLVTAHGPLNPVVDPSAATDLVTDPSARVRPAPAHGVLRAVARPVVPADGPAAGAHLHAHPGGVGLEQRVTGGHLGYAEQFLEEMFRARHGLLAVETIASLSREVYARMAKIEAFGSARGEHLIEDSVD
jgi:hypothetical protein